MEYPIYIFGYYIIFLLGSIRKRFSQTFYIEMINHFHIIGIPITTIFLLQKYFSTRLIYETLRYYKVAHQILFYIHLTITCLRNVYDFMNKKNI
jgi:hypothetical protein